MDFSTLILTMYVAAEDTPADDERVLQIAIEETQFAAELGFNPWYTEHHFRGPWHSNPMQFAAYMAPQIPRDLYFGFGVLSLPYYHPVRLVESMNLLDQLTKGRTLFGVGSGFPGVEPAGLGLDKEYHGSGRAAEDTFEVMQRLWEFRTGDPEYSFETPTQRGTLQRRVTPAPYRKPHPTIIRTARRDSSVIKAAQNGWPAFLGTFGSSLPEQARLYQKTLADAQHPPEVVQHCLRWCTVDWLSVVVADTDEEALARAELAKAEHLAMRQRFVAKVGVLEGPVGAAKHGQPAGGAYAAGGDMWETIAGSPDTVAAHVQQVADQGINHILVRFIGEWTGETRYISETSRRLFAREVAPRFRNSGSLRAAATGQRAPQPVVS